MATILTSLLLLLILFAAMAVGLMFGRGPIKGSCGGIAALTGETKCDLCGGDRVRCEEINAGKDVAPAPDETTIRQRVGHFDPREPH